VILFLNKKDLFEEKIKKKNITTAFPDYTGGQNWDEASKFIQEQFMSLNEQSEEKGVYPHFTCATDTKAVEHIFKSVQQEIQTKNAVSVL